MELFLNIFLLNKNYAIILCESACFNRTLLSSLSQAFPSLTFLKLGKSLASFFNLSASDIISKSPLLLYERIIEILIIYFY